MNILNVYFFLNHTVYCLLIILSSNYVKKKQLFSPCLQKSFAKVC